MKKELIQFLEEIFSISYKQDSKIESIEILESKLYRVIYRIRLNGDNEDFVLHFRQRAFQMQQEYNTMNHHEINGILTPKLIYYDLSNNNPFGTTFFIQKYVNGNKLSEKKNWLNKNFFLFSDNLLKLHKIEVVGNVSPRIMALKKYKTECLQKLKSHEAIDILLLESFFNSTIDMGSKIEFNSVQASHLHGDLHYSNVIISDKNRCYFIDWENTSIGDCCQDLAYFKARTLDYLYQNEYEVESDDIFKSILTQYQTCLNDSSIFKRMQYFLSAQYLELIWRSCFPKIVEKWLQFYFDKLIKYKLLTK